MTPVPPEVVDAVEEELEEPWMALLEEFVRDSLMPASKAADASSAAEIREAFFNHCHGQVAKKEIGLRMARKGFAEDIARYWNGITRTSRRVYRYRFGDGHALVALHSASTGGCGV